MNTDEFMSCLEADIDNYLYETYSDALLSCVARTPNYGIGVLAILVWHENHPSMYAMFRFHETNDRGLVDLSYRDICDGLVVEVAERIDSGEVNLG